MNQELQRTGLKFRWSPKVQMKGIWQLYQNDAKGIVDEVLVDDVGLALLLRCQSILMVTEGKAKCPQCGQVMSFAGVDVVTCSGCSWQATGHQFHESWRHRELYGGNAVPAFQAFVEKYPQARSARERVLLIDRVLHEFHFGINCGRGRCVGENLIEGNKKQVLAFLDGLTYGENSTPEVVATKGKWRDVLRNGADPRSEQSHSNEE